MLREYRWITVLPLLGFLLIWIGAPAPGLAFGPQHLPFFVPEPPPLLRFSGLLLSVPPPEDSEMRSLAVTIGQGKWDFQLKDVEALSGSHSGSLVLSQVFPRQLRFVGPEKFLQQIQDSAKAGKFVVVEGHLYTGSYKLRVTGVGDNAEGVAH